MPCKGDFPELISFLKDLSIPLLISCDRSQESCWLTKVKHSMTRMKLFSYLDMIYLCKHSISVDSTDTSQDGDDIIKSLPGWYLLVSKRNTNSLQLAHTFWSHTMRLGNNCNMLIDLIQSKGEKCKMSFVQIRHVCAFCLDSSFDGIL